MSIFRLIKEAIHKLIPYKEISSLEGVESPISAKMQQALSDWQGMYQASPPWLDENAGVRTMNVAAFVCSEIARQILLEAQYSITEKSNKRKELRDKVLAKGTNDNLPYVQKLRAEYLSEQFQSLMDALRPKLEIGCAAGGLVIKPYPKDGKLFFSFIYDWDLYPLSFDAAGNLSGVIFPDRFQKGKTYYTRLEKHVIDGQSVIITNRAFRSTNPNTLGVEINLSEVEQWADLQPEATAQNTGGMLFGWFRTANANTADLTCPLGAAVFDKATDIIKQADEKMYSALLWEFEGSQLAVDVDYSVLRPRQDADGVRHTVPRLQQRLFRGVSLPPNGEKSSFYNLFSPAIRDANYINGLNQLLIRIEDLCGLARGVMSDPNQVARTAKEIMYTRMRSYETVHDNQKALEKCLRDVIRAMDYYATAYNLAPQGDYEVSFEWDDSIITDREQQMSERLLLMNAGIISKQEMRQWYTGETEEQAAAAIAAIVKEKAAERPIDYPNLDEPQV